MRFFCLLICCCLCCCTHAQDAWKHGRLQVTPDGHYLQYEDGAPFFWLGDTGWELFHRLTLDEITTYLENRRSKGFNVIQAVLLAEFDGLTKPNQYGDLPLIDLDPLKPNEQYFKLVDAVVKIAARKNIFMGLLPTWGDKLTKMWGTGPVIFNEENAYGYGLYLGKRYQNYPNIIWIMGGDRPAKTDSMDYRPIWRAMVKGIQEGTHGKAIFTYHPWGGENSTSQFLPAEPWLNINMMQSGHGGGHDVTVWKMIERDRAITPVKPTLDAEPNYEDHPVNPWPKWDPATGFYDDYDVRKQLYRSVFAGACGVTYGHHSIWQFYSPREAVVNHAKMYWTEALDRPGAFDAGYLRMLMQSRPMQNRTPDQTIIAGQEGEKGQHIQAIRGGDNSYAFVYLPVGKQITIKTSFIKGNNIIAWWFNPRDAVATKIGNLYKKQTMDFTPPTTGMGNDWVLVIDDATQAYAEPGKAEQ